MAPVLRRARRRALLRTIPAILLSPILYATHNMSKLTYKATCLQGECSRAAETESDTYITARHWDWPHKAYAQSEFMHKFMPRWTCVQYMPLYCSHHVTISCGTGKGRCCVSMIRVSDCAGQMHLRGCLRGWGHARLLPSRQGEIKATVVVCLHIQVLMHRVADLELHQTGARLSLVL